MSGHSLQGRERENSEGRDTSRRGRDVPRAFIHEVPPLVSALQTQSNGTVTPLILARGCVTPQVIHNWAETSGLDMELVDGYEDLPEEVQQKVKRALEQGHVDDEDWQGVRESRSCHLAHANNV